MAGPNNNKKKHSIKNQYLCKNVRIYCLNKINIPVHNPSLLVSDIQMSGGDKNFASSASVCILYLPQ